MGAADRDESVQKRETSAAVALRPESCWLPPPGSSFGRGFRSRYPLLGSAEPAFALLRSYSACMDRLLSSDRYCGPDR